MSNAPNQNGSGLEQQVCEKSIFIVPNYVLLTRKPLAMEVVDTSIIDIDRCPKFLIFFSICKFSRIYVIDCKCVVFVYVSINFTLGFMLLLTKNGICLSNPFICKMVI